MTLPGVEMFNYIYSRYSYEVVFVHMYFLKVFIIRLFKVNLLMKFNNALKMREDVMI